MRNLTPFKSGFKTFVSAVSAVFVATAVTAISPAFAQETDPAQPNAQASDSAAPGAKRGSGDGHGAKRGSGGGHGAKRGSGGGHGAKRGSGGGHGAKRDSGKGHGMMRGSGKGHDMMRGSHAAHGMMKKGDAKRAMMEARLAYKKSALNITAAQTAQWDAYAELLRKRKTLKQDMRRSIKEAKKSGTAPERINLRITAMSAMLETIKSLKIETDKLYSMLDEEQKKMANVLLW